MASAPVPKIKVVDFAYSPMSNQPSLLPTSEIFNQHLGIAEVEYYWTQHHRTFPVPGKTLSRLLDLNWINEAELSERGAPIDFVKLQTHHSKSLYPWKPVHTTFTTPPTPQERNVLLQNYRSFFQHRDDTKLAWAAKEKARRIRLGAQTNCPKQYPAPLHAYDDQTSYPELVYQKDSGTNEGNIESCSLQDHPVSKKRNADYQLNDGINKENEIRSQDRQILKKRKLCRTETLLNVYT